jgi:hypothetical protein
MAVAAAEMRTLPNLPPPDTDRLLPLRLLESGVQEMTAA